MTADDRMTVFDRRAVRRHRERAAAGWPRHSFLVEEVAERLADRLLDVNRAFPLALDLGAHGGETGRRIMGVKGVERVVAMDLARGMVARHEGPAVVGDEEALPFAEGAFDLVVSNLSLHWVNDLPGALIQARLALRPDGLFLGAMLGGDTLFELRRALMEAEMESLGGLSPRLSPFAEVRDAGALLQRAGFALPVVDTETITVAYRDPLALMRELRAMGETNAVIARNRRPPPRNLFPRAVEHYVRLFAEPDGRVPATFQVLFLSGWTPAEGQQKPARRGSADARLADALGSVERSAGERAGAPLPPRPGRA